MKIKYILIRFLAPFLAILAFAIGGIGFGQVNKPDTLALKVFPGAEGFGTETRAGRGGRIIKVTNLGDDGPGSLRAAVQTPGPRIIVFEVSGVINTQSPIVITEPFITISGQTAPPPGITLSGYGLQPSTHDVLIQHLFIRVTSTDAKDGTRIIRNKKGVQIYNIVIDHVSIAWGRDENLSIVLSSGYDFTIANCLIGEGHYGVLVDYGNRNVAFIKNLIMSSTQRHPRIKGDVNGIVINNILYNCGNSSFAQVGSTEGPNNLSFIGNAFIAGPNTGSNSYGVNVYSIDPRSKLYIPPSGRDRNFASSLLFSDQVAPYLTDSAPTDGSLAAVRIVDAAVLEGYIAENVGARPAERQTIFGDSVDMRFLAELRERKGMVIDRDNPGWRMPLGGSRTFVVPADPGGDEDGDGYSNIEEILHLMAAIVEKGPEDPTGFH